MIALFYLVQYIYIRHDACVYYLHNASVQVATTTKDKDIIVAL